jgi:hypothetical protein
VRHERGKPVSGRRGAWSFRGGRGREQAVASGSPHLTRPGAAEQAIGAVLVRAAEVAPALPDACGRLRCDGAVAVAVLTGTARVVAAREDLDRERPAAVGVLAAAAGHGLTLGLGRLRRRGGWVGGSSHARRWRWRRRRATRGCENNHRDDDQTFHAFAFGGPFVAGFHEATIDPNRTPRRLRQYLT